VTISNIEHPGRHPTTGDIYRWFKNDTRIKILYHLQDVTRPTTRLGIAFLYMGRNNPYPSWMTLERFNKHDPKTGRRLWQRCAPDAPYRVLEPHEL
jgi:hypothetical protein